MRRRRADSRLGEGWGGYTGPHLLASVFSLLLVGFGLLRAVDGILLVQFQHLHLLLDGVHGGGGEGPLGSGARGDASAVG